MPTNPNSTSMLQRAQERVARVSEAHNERDADHFESEAMGYVSALRDIQALTDADFSRLMGELAQIRSVWRMPAASA